MTSGMMDKLGRPGHYTLFAPTNDAFKNLTPGHLERMMGDKDVIAGMSEALVAPQPRKSLLICLIFFGLMAPEMTTANSIVYLFYNG